MKEEAVLQKQRLLFFFSTQHPNIVFAENPRKCKSCYKNNFLIILFLVDEKSYEIYIWECEKMVAVKPNKDMCVCAPDTSCQKSFYCLANLECKETGNFFKHSF